MKKEYITPNTEYLLVNIEELLDMGASEGGFSKDEPSGARESAWDEEEQE